MNSSVPLTELPTREDRWWQTMTLELNQGVWFHFTQRSMGVLRLAQYWQFHADPEDPQSEPLTPTDIQITTSDATSFTADNCQLRVFFELSPDTITFRPALPDRDIIAKPVTPLMLLPGSSVTFYVSLPLWFLAETQQQKKTMTLIDWPIFRPSDTWFGSNTQTGRLAYASLTEARVNTQDLPQRAHRAITPLHLHHHGNEPIPISNFAIPASRLSVFTDDAGKLWTEEITMTLHDDGKAMMVNIEQDQSPGKTLISTPRQSGVLVNWISSIDKWMGRLV